MSQNKIIFGTIVVPTYFFLVTCLVTLFLVFGLGWSFATFLFFPVFYLLTFYVAWMTIRLSEGGAELRASIWPLIMALYDPGVTDDLRKERAEIQADLNDVS
jgi:hypothetical protein